MNNVKSSAAPDTPSESTDSSGKPDFELVAPSLRPTTTTRSKPDIFRSRNCDDVDFVPSNDVLKNATPYEYAIYLYNKYVKYDCDLQVNISSRVSKALIQFSKKERMEIETDDKYSELMFVLYDKAWENIYRLIDKDSFSRFKSFVFHFVSGNNFSMVCCLFVFMFLLFLVTSDYIDICHTFQRHHQTQVSLSVNQPRMFNHKSNEMVIVEENETETEEKTVIFKVVVETV